MHPSSRTPPSTQPAWMMPTPSHPTPPQGCASLTENGWAVPPELCFQGCASLTENGRLGCASLTENGYKGCASLTENGLDRTRTRTGTWTGMGAGAGAGAGGLSKALF